MRFHVCVCVFNLSTDTHSMYIVNDTRTDFDCARGIVYPKMNILSKCTHPHVITNLYDLLSFFLWNTKEDILRNISTVFVQNNSGMH